MCKSAGFIQLNELVVTTDRLSIDKNLRDGFETGGLHQPLTRFLIVGYVGCFKRNSFLLEQRLGPPTIRTVIGGVNFNSHLKAATYGSDR